MADRDVIKRLFNEPHPPAYVVCAFCSLVTASVVMWLVLVFLLAR